MISDDRLRSRLGLWLWRFWAMMLKELIQLGRDGLLVFAIAYLFLFDTYMAGNVGMNLKNAVVVVHDADHSAASRELIYRFQPPYFKQGGEVADGRSGQRLIDTGEALLVLDIPPHFEHDLLTGRPVAVQVQVDAANTRSAFLPPATAPRSSASMGSIRHSRGWA